MMEICFTYVLEESDQSLVVVDNLQLIRIEKQTLSIAAEIIPSSSATNCMLLQVAARSEVYSAFSFPLNS